LGEEARTAIFRLTVAATMRQECYFSMKMIQFFVYRTLYRYAAQ